MNFLRKLMYGRYGSDQLNLFLLIACLICLLCALFFIVLGKYIFRPDMSKLLNLEADKLDTDGSLNLTGVQKTVLLFLFLLVLLLLAPTSCLRTSS